MTKGATTPVDGRYPVHRWRRRGSVDLLNFKDYGREFRSYISPMFSKRDDLCLMWSTMEEAPIVSYAVWLLRPPGFYKTPADVKSLAFR